MSGRGPTGDQVPQHARADSLTAQPVDATGGLPPTASRWVAYTAASAALAQRQWLFLEARHELFWSLLSGTSRAARGRPLAALTKAVVRRGRTELSRYRADVVFVVDSPRDILSAAVLPVVARVEAAGLDVVVLAGAAAAHGMRGSGRDVTVLRCPFGWGDRRTRREMFDELAALFPAELGEAQSAGFNALVLGVEALDAEATRILGHLQPSLVVVARDQPAVAASMSVAARRLDIPTMALQHGTVGPFDAPLIADTYAAWGPASRDQLVSAGAEPARVAVLGSPRHDLCRTVDSAKAASLRDRLGLGDRKVFTFFSGAHAGHISGQTAQLGCVSWLEEAFEVVGDDTALVVKLHPDEDGRVYAGLRDVRLVPSTVHLGVDLATIFAISDAVGSLCSTTLQEASLHATPAFQFLAPEWPEMTDLWRRGIVTRVASADDLIAHLRRLSSHQYPDDDGAVLADRCGRAFVNIGSAANAVADHVCSIAGVSAR